MLKGAVCSFHLPPFQDFGMRTCKESVQLQVLSRHKHFPLYKSCAFCMECAQVLRKNCSGALRCSDVFSFIELERSQQNTHLPTKLLAHPSEVTHKKPPLFSSAVVSVATIVQRTSRPIPVRVGWHVDVEKAQNAPGFSGFALDCV